MRRAVDDQRPRLMSVQSTEPARPVGIIPRLTHTAARRWYPGAAIGLVYQVVVLFSVWSANLAPVAAIEATVILLVSCLVFLFLPPLLWWERESVRIVGLVAYFALTALLLPLTGTAVAWIWIYVACVAGTLLRQTRVAIGIIVAIVVVQLIVIVAAGQLSESWYIALVTVSMGVMMAAFSQQIETVRELRRAQSEIARLAVIEERSRFSRDMHDVLGHSLTVVTVKSELARRLVPIDQARAESEIADIERLSRSALADLRAAVVGYREMSFSTELAAAQSALTAADIAAHLPRNGDLVDPEFRELFGWVLREGVTNVIRHSGSRNCWVSVTADSLEIDDDGKGIAVVGDSPAGEKAPGVIPVSGGTGLDGLAVRAREAGAQVQAGASERGGLRLSVRRVAS